MSFTEAKRKAIRKYMLDKIRCGDAEFLKKTAENFAVSETSVRRYIRDCLERGLLKESADFFEEIFSLRPVLKKKKQK